MKFDHDSALYRIGSPAWMRSPHAPHWPGKVAGKAARSLALPGRVVVVAYLAFANLAVRLAVVGVISDQPVRAHAWSS